MKLIDLHKEWCEKGRMPSDGLCSSVPYKYDKLLDLFDPWEKVSNMLLKNSYWGYGEDSINSDKIEHDYTPLRQTIVLLICAMKNEI